MKKYTHIDKKGILWRFGKDVRPVSKLADEVVEEVFGKYRMTKTKMIIPKRATKTVKRTSPKIDLSFMKAQIVKEFKGQRFALPKFVPYNFHPFATCPNTQRSFVIHFSIYKSCLKESFILGNWWFASDNPEYLDIHEILKRQKEIIFVPRGKAIKIIELDDNECKLNKYLSQALHKPEIYQFSSLDKNKELLTCSWDEKGLDFYDGWGADIEEDIKITSTYSGIIPRKVQQIIRQAQKEYEEIDLITESNWEKIEVLKRNVDPLIVGYKNKQFYLLCKFDETVMENYYISEFAS